MLWATDNSGETWRDTGGRTFGRHTTFAFLKDGGILAMGGKNSHIGNFMPRGISHDGGKTYELSATPFSQLNSGQRPSVLRLASGRLFMAGDFQPSKNGKKPDTIKETGCYVALSDDDGGTWRIKRLPGAYSAKRKAASVGYSVARQAPDGLIHLVTTLNHPALHFVLNEAWILSDDTFADDDPAMMRSRATRLTDVQSQLDAYADGRPRVAWKAGVADDGRVLLDGEETWYYRDGTKQRSATYALGERSEEHTSELQSH